MSESSGLKTNRALHVAFIGSGPVSMLKAIRLAAAHPHYTITILDSASQIGGAWYTDLSPKGHEIECGCHIWSYVPKAYRLIEKELDIKLFDVHPRPVFVGKKMNLPYSLKNTVDTYKAFFKTLVSFKWKNLRNFRTDPNMNFRIFFKYNKYPKTGSPELLHALQQKLNAQSNIIQLLNTDIKSVNVSSKVKLETSVGNMEFDKVFFTYVSRISSIVMNGIPISIESKRVEYIHFLIQLNKPLIKKISYWRFINDPVIHRITDISYQTNYSENLLLIGIKENAYKSTEEVTLLEHAKELLVRHNLIDQSTSLVILKTHIFPTYYLSDETITNLKKDSEKFSFVHTTDLMHGVHALIAHGDAI
jgi:hypothetical protein